MRRIFCPRCGSKETMVADYNIREDDKIVVTFECDCWEVFDVVYDIAGDMSNGL